MQEKVLAQLRLTAYVILVTVGVLSLYTANAPDADGFLPRLYLASVVGYYGAVWIGLGVLMLPAALWRWSAWLFPTLVWMWFVYLLIDVITFNLYQFHVDWLILEMLIFDFRGMGLPDFVFVLAAAILVAILGLVVILQRLARSAFAGGRVALAALPVLVLPAFAVNSVIHIWANRFDREEVTRYNPYFPIFHPVRSYKDGARISELWPALFPPEAGERSSEQEVRRGIVRYPREGFDCEAREDLDSILMIVLESWQADTLTPEIMPNLWRFAESGTRFDRHLASGTVTVAGVFGLLFGLHPTYHELFAAAPNSNPSVFTETLDRLGYRMRVFTGNNLSRFSLRTLIFSRVDESDYFDGRTDRWLVDQYLASLDDEPGRGEPRFDFLFLTSSHSSYHYPEEYARFRPLPAVEGGYIMNKMTDAVPYKNDYRNSLYYLDSLLAEVFAALERRGELGSTWVVVVGDHAEEFNENGLGYWGHGSNFSRWQTQTPLILRGPGVRSGEVETNLSLHQDVVPTLMQEVLGCSGAVETYANGANLLALPHGRGTIFTSYYAKAYWVDEVILDRTTGRKYAWADMKQVVRNLENPDAVRALMLEERRFLAVP